VTLYTLTAKHGDDLDAADLAALQTIRRTLRGMLGHGFIADFETYSDHDMTVWSYRPGSEDGAQLMLGLIDVVRAVAPNHWTINTEP
jgi:hypothetical protein